MTDIALIYRDQMVRGVLGSRPAILSKEANTTLLDSLSYRLADAEVAMELLRAKGYGHRGLSLADMVKALPPAPQAGPAIHDIWSSQ
jgi:hypothetical protein